MTDNEMRGYREMWAKYHPEAREDKALVIIEHEKVRPVAFGLTQGRAEHWQSLYFKNAVIVGLPCLMMTIMGKSPSSL